MEEARDPLVEAKRLTAEFKACLPTGYDVGSVSIHAKIPSKALSLREALIHRASDLADAAILLYERERFVPACIIIRSLMETTGTLFWLHKKVRRAVEDQSLEGIDKWMMRGLLGSWEHEDEFSSPLSGRSAVNHIDKAYDKFDFREMYDGLSEYVHTNWLGTSGAYSRIDKENMRVSFGASTSGQPWHFMLGPLVIALLVFRERYNDMAKTFRRFVDLCESDLDLGEQDTIG